MRISDVMKKASNFTEEEIEFLQVEFVFLTAELIVSLSKTNEYFNELLKIIAEDGWDRLGIDVHVLLHRFVLLLSASDSFRLKIKDLRK